LYHSRHVWHFIATPHWDTEDKILVGKKMEDEISFAALRLGLVGGDPSDT
jgi:hypothetical protein